MALSLLGVFHACCFSHSADPIWYLFCCGCFLPLLRCPIPVSRSAPFEFYDPASPIYTSPRFLPPAKIEEDCSVQVSPGP
jgi:hypothetical protein